MSLKYLATCFSLFIIFIIALVIFMFVSHIGSVRLSFGSILDIFMLILMVIGLIYQGYKFSDFAEQNKYMNAFIVSFILTIIMAILALSQEQTITSGNLFGLVFFLILFEIGSAIHYFKNR